MNIRMFLKHGVAALAATTSMGTAVPAQAGSSSGTINVQLTITSACLVNGTASTASFGSAGTIAFPNEPGTFTQTDAQLVGSLGDLAIRCSPGTTPTLTIGSGLNDDSGVRRMASGANRIGYRLYSDAGRSQEVTVGQSIALGTMGQTAVTVPLYARATNSGVLPAGAYADTVQVTLAW